MQPRNSIMQLLFWMVLISPLLGAATALASDSEASSSGWVQVSEAKWKAGDGKLAVKAKGQWSGKHKSRERVRVYDADSGQRLFGRRVEVHDDGRWQMEAQKRLDGDGPCRIRVVAGSDSAEAAVENASASCNTGGGDTSGGDTSGGDAGALASVSEASSSGWVQVSEAKWKADDGKLAVKAEGKWSGKHKSRERVRVYDADSDQRLFGRRVEVHDDGRWQMEAKKRLDGDGPCRIRVVAGGDSAEAAVENAPASCNTGGGDTGGGDTGGGGTGGGGTGGGGTGGGGTGGGTGGDISINSTSANANVLNTPVMEQPLINNGSYALLASNDLGMHCADLDYRVFSILPPFNVVHAQVVKKGQGGQEPQLQDDTNLELVYSAASNPLDPALSRAADPNVFKSNFWDDPDGDGQTFGFDTYAPLFFGLLKPTDIADQDVGLPVPDSVLLRGCLQGYLSGAEGPEGPRAKCGLGQQTTPGIASPYVANDPQLFDRFDRNINFFNELLGGLGLGTIVADTNWWAADAVPMTPVDDHGRRNAYPLMRVQARDKATGQVVASTDVVLPVASEADCQNCHAPVVDCASTAADTGLDIQCIGAALDRTVFDVMTLDGDTAGNSAPGDTPLEQLSNVAKINVLRVHDAKHGTTLDLERPVQCSTCHYSPALDLAQLGPTDSPATDQTGHITMSRAMHGYHGDLADTDTGELLFPDMPSPVARDSATTKQVLDETCYQCHPGKRTQCLRGAMAKGGVVCQDCHGDMRHVGNDFSGDMSPTNRWPAAANLSKRVPWASEPACQSCHTGDAVDNLAGVVSAPVASDGIRLLQAYSLKAGLDATGNPDGTEVAQVTQATNKRFAESESLYRISKGHGGVMCEGCHGSTHAIFPNPIDASNDNVAAKQLQGHAGTVIECTTCHEGDLGLTLDGPHGMHPVGDTKWARDHEDFAENNRGACRSCHGANGEGTVLSRTATARTLQCKDSKGSWCSAEDQMVQITAGTKVGCSNCHENEL